MTTDAELKDIEATVLKAKVAKQMFEERILKLRNHINKIALTSNLSYREIYCLAK